MNSRTLLLVALASLAVTPAVATLTVQGAEAGSLNTPLRDLPRTYLAAYENVTLTGATGPVFITGVSFFTSATTSSITGSWPTSSITFSDYTIVMGGLSQQFLAAGEFLNTTSTFASWSTGLQTVRSGALTVEASAFTPGAFSTTITFDTPFVYDVDNDPGLLFGFVHQGAPGGASTLFPVATRGFANFGSTTNSQGADAIFASNGNGFDVAPSSFIDPIIVRFETTPVPEPATMLVLAGAAALAARRRRKA